MKIDMIRVRRMQKRDISIEAMRIIACFFVICIHLGVGFFINGSLSRSSVFIACVVADAVAIFWFITGAFLFKRDKYSIVLKSTLKNVILPTLILIMFVLFLNGWMFEGISLKESIGNAMWRVPPALKCIILKWSTPVAHTGQIWYVFAYTMMMIIFPVMKSFVEKIEKDHKEKQFLIISFGLLLLNDISNNMFLKLNHTVLGVLIPAFIMIIWGNIIYSNRKKIIKDTNPLIYLILFIIVNIIRALLLVIISQRVGGRPESSIIFWYSCFSLFTVPLLFLFFIGIKNSISKNKLVNRLIIKLGSYTFMIYLLHELIIDYLKKINLYTDLRYSLLLNGDIFTKVLFYIVLGGIVFLLCLIISIILRLLLFCAKNIINFLCLRKKERAV